MHYELWDHASGNRIDGYDDMAGLTQVVRELVELNGEEVIEDLFVRVWNDYESEPVGKLEGDELRAVLDPGRPG